MTQDALVSVVICVKNEEKVLAACLESITSQSYKNIEVVVVDDGSTDGTASILRRFSECDSRINVLTNSENIGVASSRNLGCLHSQGEFIAVQDADDFSHPDRIRFQLDAVSYCQADVMVADIVCIAERDESRDVFDGITLPSLDRCSPKVLSTADFAKGNVFAHGTFFMSKRSYLTVGGYDESLALSEDFDLLWRYITSKEINVIYCPEKIYAYRLDTPTADVVFQRHLIGLDIRGLQKPYIARSRVGYQLASSAFWAAVVLRRKAAVANSGIISACLKCCANLVYPNLVGRISAKRGGNIETVNLC